MKKILSVAIIALSLISCKSSTDDVANTKDIIILGDSSTLIPGNTLTDTALLITTNADGTTTSTAVVPGEKPKAVAPSPKPVVTPKATAKGSTTSTNSGGSTASTTTTTQKKGISKAAKGAIIGGVGGAAAGAIIGRNAKGAAIGAGVGAAGGYIIGRSKDKKDGRN